MIPAGYMLKAIVSRPDWRDAPAVDRIFSVSGCICPGFMDFIPLWRHNGWWLFDSPQALHRIAEEHSLDLNSLTLFYYEVYESECDQDGNWRPIGPDPNFVTNVAPPNGMTLRGYDIVTFSANSSPECSPLSCNAMAKEMLANKWCLFTDFSAARDRVQRGEFNHCEPGPYRIFAVYALGGRDDAHS